MKIDGTELGNMANKIVDNDNMKYKEIKYEIPENVIPIPLRKRENRYLRFFNGIKYTNKIKTGESSDGNADQSKDKIEVEEYKDIDLDIPIEKSHEVKNAEVEIYEMSENYVVFSCFKRRYFVIVKRKQFEQLEKTKTFEKEALNPIGEEFRRFIELKSSNAFRIEFPRKILKIITNGDQIIFRSNEKIYFYTPFSMSSLDVASSDIILVSSSLYVLTPRNILIYEEFLVRIIDVGFHSDFIRTIGDITFFISGTLIYKFHKESFVAAYTSFSIIHEVHIDSKNLYLCSTNKFVVIDIFTGHSTVFKVDFELFTMKMSENFLILNAYNNVNVFIDRRDYSRTRMVVLNRLMKGIACFSDVLCYFFQSKLILHRITNNYEDNSIGSKTEDSVFVNQSSNGDNGLINFDEILEYYGDEMESEVTFVLDEETGDVNVLENGRAIDNVPEHIANVCNYVNRVDESSSDSENELVLFEENISNENQVSVREQISNGHINNNHIGNGHIGNCAVRNAVSEKTAYEEYVETLKATGIANPIQKPWKILELKTGKNVEIVNLINLDYRPITPKFFIPNYMDWYEKMYEEFEYREREVDFSVFEFLEYALRARDEVPADGGMEERKKKRISRRDAGGF